MTTPEFTAAAAAGGTALILLLLFALLAVVKARRASLEMQAKIDELACRAEQLRLLNRPYRKSLPRTEAYAELQRVAGAQLDPELVKAFGRVIAAPEGATAAAIAPI